ncbi:hypothetical protein DEDE109153_04080 [Deinococcus deserti]|uniref:Uncharacterized protein n=1 Tax=Deinococcus deserti (strain DSM 17065 / CIP 109153 / LMG 22923 / VCD115) TaxID=546414 RepID=X5H5D7_DEIDV|nr:hypothetical protein [Deinococcus deserti]AHX26490.1 hypothetical protein Deide_05864 [Deinococcus deserti VCD115]
MLTVKMHLAGGDIIALNMTPSQKNRLSKTINQAQLPTLPFTANVDGVDVEIPWRSISYISSYPQVQSSPVLREAAM